MADSPFKLRKRNRRRLRSRGKRRRAVLVGRRIRKAALKSRRLPIIYNKKANKKAKAQAGMDRGLKLKPSPADSSLVKGHGSKLQADELQSAYQSGYQDGYFNGGEAIVGRLLPPHTLLPDVSLEHLVATGLGHLPGEYYLHLLPSSTVFEEIRAAIQARRPFSLVRLGDGELLTMAHGTVISEEEAVRRGPFLPYAGVKLPNVGLGLSLAEAVRRANLIGVPESRHPSFQGLLSPVCHHYGLDLRSFHLTSSTVNFALCQERLLYSLLLGSRVLVIGNHAERLGQVLGHAGITVSGKVLPVLGTDDVERTIDRAAAVDFDIALVSAGVAAVLICVQLAERFGKVALDFGHVADKLGSGELAFP